MLFTIFIFFVLLLVIGVPIAFVIGAAGAFPMVIFGQYPLQYAAMATAQSVDSFSYLAIPFFILCGELMNSGGLSKRLVDFVSSLIGSVSGGLAVITVVASMFFGAISGSGPATVAAIGGILIPYMVKEGYGPGWSGAVAATSGCIGLFIPPSIAMITYGVAAEQSISDMFLSGIGPGILTTVALVVLTVTMAKKRGYRNSEKFSADRIKETFGPAILPLFMPIIIMGGIYSGVFTATESAAVACLYAFIVGTVVTRELKLKDIKNIFKDAAITTCTIMIIIGFAGFLGRLLTLEQLPIKLTNFVYENEIGKIEFLLIVNVIMLFLGTFMELNASILILTPILLPIAKTLGIHPIHLGAIIVVNMTFGLITPPLGVNLYVASGISGRRFEETAKEILPFIVVAIVIILATTFIPQLTIGLIG
ncbi:MAG: TRAP transporter large permease [Peptoniphilus sp.]|nr:TRAP transporter large permease [Peptoniphilus sp.]